MNIAPLIAVLGTVILGVLSALSLDYLSDLSKPSSMILAIGYVIVLAINAGRLLVWNHIHKLYPLSMSYPLTAIFFPIILFIAHLQGEKTTFIQWLGVTIIMVGVCILSTSKLGETE